jgi:hypothetical protein
MVLTGLCLPALGRSRSGAETSTEPQYDARFLDQPATVKRRFDHTDNSTSYSCNQLPIASA